MGSHLSHSTQEGGRVSVWEKPELQSELLFQQNSKDGDDRTPH